MQLLATAGSTSWLFCSRKPPNSPSVACCELTQLRSFCKCRHRKSHSPPAPHPSLASFCLLAPVSCWMASGSPDLAFSIRLSQDVTRQGCFSLRLTGCLIVVHGPLIQCQCSATPHVCPRSTPAPAVALCFRKRQVGLVLDHWEDLLQSRGAFHMAPRAVAEASEDVLQSGCLSPS